MSTNRTRNSDVSDANVRSISTWVQRYATHQRGLAVVVGLLINFAIFGVISLGAYFGGQAYRANNLPMALVGIGSAAIGCVVVLYMAFTTNGQELPGRIARRLVGDEGEVVLDRPISNRKRQVGVLMAVLFGACILAQVLMGDAIPVRYRQPVSALYCVPFLIGAWQLQRPASSYLALLWPALFCLHAILLLLGVPILFTGRWEAMNMLLPVIGYGVLVHFVSHLYARYAFHRIRQLATIDESGA